MSNLNLKPAEAKRLCKQIQRLCEKQYRKGFQQGFYAAVNEELSEEQVDQFRLDGMTSNYSKVVHPHTGRPENPASRLMAEMQMEGMEDLIRLMGIQER